jgi:hypothetical protein
LRLPAATRDRAARRRRREFHLLPRGLRFTTGRLAEHWIVSPLPLALLAFLLWR